MGGLPKNEALPANEPDPAALTASGPASSRMVGKQETEKSGW
jgi:hypothetical protein